MFSQCFSLKSLNLSNFDTSSVEQINNMFYNCSSLMSLDLLNFNTSQVKNMSTLKVKLTPKINVLFFIIIFRKKLLKFLIIIE